MSIMDSLQIEFDEKERLLQLNFFEDQARSQGYQIIAGIDEAGRGPLAGPVVAAVCVIPQGIYFPQINDSKQLNPLLRQKIFDQIVADKRVSYAIGIVDSLEIDRINIYQATIQAMMIALSGLPFLPDYILVDGMKLPHPTVPCQKIIKGDTLSQSIAAASILAKVTRDQIMVAFHERWPLYGFKQHKGYATSKHLEALEKYGPCEIHRRSFEPCKASDLQLTLF